MGKKEQKKKFNSLIEALVNTWQCGGIDCTDCPFSIKGKTAQKISLAATGDGTCGAVAIRDFAKIIYEKKNPDKVVDL